MSHFVFFSIFVQFFLRLPRGVTEATTEKDQEGHFGTLILVPRTTVRHRLRPSPRSYRRGTAEDYSTMWPSGKPSTLPSAPPGIPAAASPFKSKPTSLFDGIFDDVLSKSKSAAAHVPEHPSYLASLGTDDVHDQLESIAAEGRKTNLGNVTLEVYPLKSVGDKSHVFDQPAVSMNICEQTGVWSAYARLYFSDEYKMDATNWTEDFGGSKLYKYIMQAANDGRNPITANGGGKHARDIVCKDFHRHERKDVTSRKKNIGSIEYRPVQVVNDRKLTRQGGRALSRKTSHADTSSGPCKFKFKLKCDEIGPYISLENNAGCGFHNNHPLPMSSKCIPVPLKLLSDEVKQTAVNVVESAASHATGRNFLLRNQDVYINKARMAYLGTLSKGVKNST